MVQRWTWRGEVEAGARGLVRGTLFFDWCSESAGNRQGYKKLGMTLQTFFFFFSCAECFGVEETTLRWAAHWSLHSHPNGWECKDQWAGALNKGDTGRRHTHTHTHSLFLLKGLSKKENLGIHLTVKVCILIGPQLPIPVLSSYLILECTRWTFFFIYLLFNVW